MHEMNAVKTLVAAGKRLPKWAARWFLLVAGFEMAAW
jgi:hypothetical protein